MFRARERAFKQFKCPRPQCVNAYTYLRLFGLHFAGITMYHSLVVTKTLGEKTLRFHVLVRTVAMQRFKVKIFVRIAS